MFVSPMSLCFAEAEVVAVPPSLDPLLFGEIPLIGVSVAQEMFWILLRLSSCSAAGLSKVDFKSEHLRIAAWGQAAYSWGLQMKSQGFVRT